MIRQVININEEPDCRFSSTDKDSHLSYFDKNKLQIITLNFKTMKQYFVLLFACMALWGCGGQDQIETRL